MSEENKNTGNENAGENTTEKKEKPGAESQKESAQKEKTGFDKFLENLGTKNWLSHLSALALGAFGGYMAGDYFAKEKRRKVEEEKFELESKLRKLNREMDEIQAKQKKMEERLKKEEELQNEGQRFSANTSRRDRNGGLAGKGRRFGSAYLD